MIAVYLIIVFSVVSGELIVSSPEEVSRERLEREATLLDTVERETECEAVTEREDTYEVIIDTDGERRPDKYVIGGWTSGRVNMTEPIIYVTEIKPLSFAS